MVKQTSEVNSERIETPQERFDRFAAVLASGLGRFQIAYEIVDPSGSHPPVTVEGIPVYVDRAEAESDVVRLKGLVPAAKNIRVEEVSVED